MKASKLKFSYEVEIALSDSPKLLSPDHSYQCFLTVFPGSEIERREFAFALYLNRENVVIGSSMIAVGGQSSTLIDPKILFQEALTVNAAAIVLAHNHPSGNLTASESDKSITNQLVQCGKFLSLPLLDHLIISKNGYLSMANEGML